MIILLVFAFISGLVTILAPCIWPILPIILSSASTGERHKPHGITLGLMTSFAVFTLTISYIVKIIPFDPNVLRLFAVLIIGFLGITLVVPKISRVVEGYVSRLSSRFGPTGKPNKSGFWGGYITGFSLGIVWSPCAGPILATIATLAATRAVSFELVLVTLAYVIGTGIPLLLFATFGSHVFSKTRFLSRYTGRIQQIFGVIMILTAIAIYTNFDKTLQVKLLDVVPAYSQFLYKLEGSKSVQQQLALLKNKKITPSQSDLPVMGTPGEFIGIYKWLNLPANQQTLSLSQLKGKVVLVDFWTYTCINCIRTLPHVTEWYEKYKDKGFVVIGIHTPEFEFEKNTQNVQRAMKQYNINYPVAQDNDYATWNAYNNHYWPAHYLIDKNGVIRHAHFGEGEYDVMEKAIQSLLIEKGEAIDTVLSNPQDQAPQGKLTPETYVGSARMDRFASPESITGKSQIFTTIPNIPEDYFTLAGSWTVGQDQAITGKRAALDFNFSADKVFLVITPKNGGTVHVFLDGKPVSEKNKGMDVSSSVVKLDTPRLYNLIDLHGQGGTHQLHLEFDTEGTGVYAFTFG